MNPSPHPKAAQAGSRRPPAARPATSFASWPRVIFYAGLPLLGVALGGATARWSEGVMLCALGLALLAAPPRASLGKGINAVLAGLVLLALTAFLPWRWFMSPAWRTALTGDFGVSLPATLTTQPWLSAESFVLFLAGLGWFYLMATVNWTGEERPRAGRLFAGGVVALAAACVVLFRLQVEPPIWHAAVHYGPFPNRNQTANFLGVGALVVLACAHLSWRGGRRVAAAGWLVGWAVVVTALFHNISRAGVGILFAGTAAYLGNEMIRAGRNRPPARSGAVPVETVAGRRAAIRWRALALAVSMILLLASGFMIFGGDTLQRVRPASVDSAVAAATSDFRVSIQRDALDMIVDSPWCGVGLGSFEPLFATYRRRSATEMHVIHPESDWLWMASELGWPSGVLVLAGCGLLARRVWPQRRGTDRPLRAAAALGVAAFALHGTVDVSAHRVGTVFCALFVLGLAMPGAREGEDSRPPARWPVPVFRLLGVLLLAVGAIWLLADQGKVRVPGSQEVARLSALTRLEAEKGDDAAAAAAASQGLALDPVNWRLYFQRARARLISGGDHAASLADFRRALYLEPFFSNVPAVAASLWAQVGESDLAVNALLEACRRDPHEARGYFDNVHMASRNAPIFLVRLEEATRRDPGLELVFLETALPADLDRIVKEIVAADPELRHYNDLQRARLFRLWASADSAGMAAAMQAHPDWQKVGWRLWMEACARADALDQACRIAAEHAPKPTVPPDPAAGGGGIDGRSRAELRLAAEQTPTDPALALRLYRAQHAAGDMPGALATLHRMTVLPGCPVYFHYLEATFAMEAGRWDIAWAAWQKYLAAIPGNG